MKLHEAMKKSWEELPVQIYGEYANYDLGGQCLGACSVGHIGLGLKYSWWRNSHNIIDALKHRFPQLLQSQPFTNGKVLLDWLICSNDGQEKISFEAKPYQQLTIPEIIEILKQHDL